MITKIASPAELLGELISIPSVSPMGRDVEGDIYFESRLSDWLENYFRQLGAVCERIPVMPGRDNLLAYFDAGSDRPTVLWDVHQDTVPVEGMTIEPFNPKHDQGRIYGRGAADVKGSMASMLHAFTRLHHERPHGAANVILSCSCDEEATAQGVQHLVGYWTNRPGGSQRLMAAPSLAIVAEPTDLDVVVAHRGVLRFRVTTHGRACHSSQTELGDNAIYTMAKVIERLSKIAHELEVSPHVHPRCGGARLSVGRIEGGTAVNIVPDYCAIEIDRRLIPGEQAEDVYQGLCQQFIDLGERVLCERPWLVSPALGDDNNTDLAKGLLRAIASVVGEHQAIGVPFCTNAAMISSSGVPTVVFGPGSIAQAHTADEWIDVAQLDAAAEIYYRFAADGGGVD